MASRKHARVMRDVTCVLRYKQGRSLELAWIDRAQTLMDAIASIKPRYRTDARFTLNRTMREQCRRDPTTIERLAEKEIYVGSVWPRTAKG